MIFYNLYSIFYGLFYWAFPLSCEEVGNGFLVSISQIDTLRFSNFHIYLLSPPDSKAPGQQSTVSYPPLWCLADLPGTHGGTRICESFHLTAPNFTSRLWLSVCLLLLPRKSDSRILLKSCLFYNSGHENNENKDLIKLEHPLDFESKFLCQKEHKCQPICLRSPGYQSGKTPERKPHVTDGKS